MPTNSDKIVLVECLTLIRGELGRIIDQQELFRKEFLVYIPGPWPEVVRHFQFVQEQINNDQVDWRYVEGVGLTGEHLLWKRNILREAAKQGIIKRFLHLANTFLGSLSSIPGVEFIKEYKEFVEGCMKINRGL